MLRFFLSIQKVKLYVLFFLQQQKIYKTFALTRTKSSALAKQFILRGHSFLLCLVQFVKLMLQLKLG